MCPLAWQVQRPPSRRTSVSGRTRMSATTPPAAPRWANKPPNASACATVRGKPSRTAPWRNSGWANRSEIIWIVTSSGTSIPWSRKDLASLPRSLSVVTWWRNRSPLDKCRTPIASDARFACVPFPAPGGPNKTTKRVIAPPSSTHGHGRVVPAQFQLGLDRPIDIPHDADHDQQAGRRRRQQGGIRAAGRQEQRPQERQDGDEAQEEGADERDAPQQAGQVLLRRP